MKRTAIFLILLAACTQPEKKTDAPSFRAMGQSVAVEPSRNDESIGFEVRRRLDLIGAGDSAGIIVEVADGVVTLRGVAPTVAAAWRAEGAARAVKDVKQVVNLVVAR